MVDVNQLQRQLSGATIAAVKFNRFGEDNAGRAAYNMQLVLILPGGDPMPKVLSVDVQETECGDYGVVFRLGEHVAGVNEPKARKAVRR